VQHTGEACGFPANAVGYARSKRGKNHQFAEVKLNIVEPPDQSCAGESSPAQ
jgi:hypothetical protein